MTFEEVLRDKEKAKKLYEDLEELCYNFDTDEIYFCEIQSKYSTTFETFKNIHSLDKYLNDMNNQIWEIYGKGIEVKVFTSDLDLENSVYLSGNVYNILSDIIFSSKNQILEIIKRKKENELNCLNNELEKLYK